MLRKLGESPACVRISEAEYPAPFRSGLEYNPPARGVWNIVHTGMLVPEAHQIFVCAQGCLRGVVLTAAEMNALDRMSWISVEEQDMFDGSMESDIIEGTAEILNKLPKQPRAVLLFLSCIHLFAGCDFGMILNELRERFPHIDFADCYMTPTMRKSITPDAKMRIQLYDMLKPVKLNENSVSIIGNDRATDEGSELVKIIRRSGKILRDITYCKSYDEYLDMAQSTVNITYIPNAKPAGEMLESRLGAKHLYLPASFDYDEIRANYGLLCERLGVETPDFSKDISKAENALEHALDIIGDTPVAVDFTAVTRPFGFAWLLCRHGFNLRYIFADVIGAEDKDAFEQLRENFPDIIICSAVNTAMQFTSAEKEKVLAVGQKAAYYCGTDNFVNIVSNGGYYGFAGIAKLAELMEDAFENPKDRRRVIQLKGFGCQSCLE